MKTFSLFVLFLIGSSLLYLSTRKEYAVERSLSFNEEDEELGFLELCEDLSELEQQVYEKRDKEVSALKRIVLNLANWVRNIRSKRLLDPRESTGNNQSSNRKVRYEKL